MFPPTPTRNERRLPMRPLLELTCANFPELADASGYSAKTLSSWARSGIPMSCADWVATRCGFHPCNVWPDFQDEPHTVAELAEDHTLSLF